MPINRDFSKMNVKSSGFFCICSKKCSTVSLYLKIFPAWDCFGPSVGTDQSRHGTKLFLPWEMSVKKGPAIFFAGLISSLFDNNLSDCTVSHQYKVETLLRLIQYLSVRTVYADNLFCQRDIRYSRYIAGMNYNVMGRHRLW